jgi:hypothetical protein
MEAMAKSTPIAMPTSCLCLVDQETIEVNFISGRERKKSNQMKTYISADRCRGRSAHLDNHSS